MRGEIDRRPCVSEAACLRSLCVLANPLDACLRLRLILAAVLSCATPKWTPSLPRGYGSCLQATPGLCISVADLRLLKPHKLGSRFLASSARRVVPAYIFTLAL